MRSSFVLALLAVGCGDGEPTPDPYQCMAAGGAGCFQLPTKPVTAVDAFGRPTQLVLDCGPYEMRTSAAPVTFSGTTVNAIDRTAVPLVHVETFADVAMTKLLGDTISNELGDYSFTISAMPSQVHLRTFATGALPVHALYSRADVAVTEHAMTELVTASRANLASMLELVGDRFEMGTSQVTGFALDCDGNRLVNVVANVAPASAVAGSRQFEPGVRTYYTIDRATPALGRRVQLMQTTVAGSFAASNLEAGRHYVQIWGFPAENALADGDDGLELLGEAEILVPSTETGIFVELHARLR
jgi:hypothetical protein